MIGIDLATQRAVLAAFENRRPSVLGEGQSLEDLVRIAQSKFGDSPLKSSAVVAVPAWANDQQRQRAAQQTKEAGFENVRVINRPTAVALAYVTLYPAERTHLLVLELELDHLDVTVLSRSPFGFDVLRTDGAANLDPLLASNPDKLFEEIEGATQRALQTADLKPNQIDILCVGPAPGFKTVPSHLSEFFGRHPSTQVRPDHAVALGAAVQAGLNEKRGESAAPTPPHAAVKSGRGCLLLVAELIFAVASVLRFL